MTTLESDIYDRALAGEHCRIRAEDGTTTPLRAARWLGAGNDPRERLADNVLTCYCDGPTVDLGCGPGRLVASLVRRGVIALGIDISPMAVALTRFRGAPALQRDIFGPLPGTGRWAYAILADGNLGIGGDPVRLLSRTRELLAPGGTAIVEFARPGIPPAAVRIRLESRTGVGDWVPWARVGIDRAPDVAAAAGLRLQTTAEVSGRYIAWLQRPAVTS